ncbi:MAG TPA: VCBS repeat-containing protein, partial [Chloroflexota bacterium]|nr:VCBS repeat-containing protein [Chloroflexota bacterium]
MHGNAIDIDNDGREALLAPQQFPNVLRFMRPTWQTTELHYTGWPTDSVGVWAYPVDLDGDGLKDVLLCDANQTGYLKNVGGPGSDGTLGQVVMLPAYGPCDPNPVLADVDGDGVVNLLRPDFKPPVVVRDPLTGDEVVTAVGQVGNHWKALMLTGFRGQLFQPTWVDVDLPIDGHWMLMPMDVNGDGLQDLVGSLPEGSLHPLFLNLGDYRFRRVTGTADANPGLVFDFDGDGNDDFLRAGDMYRWVGGGLAPQVQPAPVGRPFVAFNGPPENDASGRPFFADVDGDGDLDLIEVGNDCLQAFRSGPATFDF